MPRRPFEWLTISTLVVTSAVPSLLISLVIPVLPDLPDELGVSIGTASWTITATLLSCTITLPILSRMADMYGRRRILMLSLVCLVVGSALAAFAGSFTWVLAGRLLQGVAGAAVPICFALAERSLAPARVNPAVALMSAGAGLGLAFGLPIAGLIRSAWGWPSVFWVPGAIGFVLLFAVMASVPPDRPASRARFDVLGAAVLSVTLTGLLIALSYGPVWGWGSARVLLLLGVSGVGAGAWVPLQLRLPYPTIDLRLASVRPVLLTNLASVFVSFAVLSNLIVTALQVTAPGSTGYGFGLNTLDAGLLMVPQGLVMVAMAPIAGTLLTRWGAEHALAGGCLAMAAVFVLRLVADGTIAGVVITTSLIGAGLAMALAAIPRLILDAVPPADSAAANGVNNLLRALASCVTSAALALIVSALTVNVGGQDYMSRSGLHLCFWLSAFTCALAAGFAGALASQRASSRIVKASTSRWRQ